LKAALSDQARDSKKALDQWKKWHKEEINNLVRVYEGKKNKKKKSITSFLIDIH